jgi:deazaflavin-dependent oxidoreductase (nitroreductase family)
MSTAPDFKKPHINFVVKCFSGFHSTMYRLLGGRGVGGGSVALLTTVGRKSGKKRTKPVMYGRDGDNVIVVASRAGTTDHPLWYKNLLKTPEVQVKIGSGADETRVARTATPEEKERLWPMMVEVYKDFAEYQTRTDRDIPVVILEPVS